MFLLKFGITGVQDFIGTARKLRDSAVASAIVTHLMRKVIEEADAVAGLRRLLPADPTACSHQVTYLADLDRDGVCEAARRLRDSFRHAWSGLAGTVSPNAAPEFAEQVAHAFAPIWAAVGVEGDTAGADFGRLQTLFHQRKATRTFAQNPTVGPTGGCFLCARRDFVVRLPRLGANGAAGAGETLCAVCWVKRRLDPAVVGAPKLIPSTSAVAAQRFLESVAFPAATQDLQAALDLLGCHPTQLGFASLEELVLDHDPVDVSKLSQEACDLLEPALDDARRRTDRATEGQSYYGICLFDGDDMGAWFAAEDSRRLAGDGPLSHLERVGAALTQFSEAARVLPLRSRSLRVYLGGDDGLLFVGLDEALTTAEHIRQAFRDSVQGLAGGGPTVSMALTVAHESAPLQDVLARTRAALADIAKARPGKNALVLVSLLGTGASCAGCASWDAVNPSFPAWLGRCVHLTQTNGGLSPRFWQELCDQLPVCFRITADGSGAGHHLDASRGAGMLRALAARLWEQHSEAIDDEREVILAGLNALAMQSETPAMDPLENFVGIAKGIVLLARKAEASGDLP